MFVDAPEQEPSIWEEFEIIIVFILEIIAFVKIKAFKADSFAGAPLIIFYHMFKAI